MAQARDNNNRIISRVMLMGTIQKIAYTAAAGTSAAFQATTKAIRIVCTSDAWVLISAGGTVATIANSMFVKSGVVELWAVPTGGKVSVIRDTADGSISIVEVA